MADQEFMKQYLKTTVDDGFVKAKDTQRSTEYADDHFGQFYKGIKVDGGDIISITRMEKCSTHMVILLKLTILM